MLRLKDLLTDIARARFPEGDSALLTRRAGLLLEGVEGVYPILSLGATRLRLAAHPLQFAAIEVEGTLTQRLGLLVALLTLGEVVVIVTLIAVERPGIELDDLIADAIEEVAIMGDQQQSHRGAAEVVLQPLDAG